MRANTAFHAFVIIYLLLQATSFASVPVPAWSTYLGGPGDDRLNDVTLAPDGDVLVCGNTTGTLLAGITPTLIGSDDPARLAFHGGFIAKISPDGQEIRWMRRFGRGVVFLTDVQTDGNFVYATGVATSLAQTDLITPYNGYDKNAPDTVKSEYTGSLTTHTAPDTYRSILIQLNADASAIINASWMGEPTPGRESYGVGDLIGDWYVASDMWRYMKQREAWAFSFMNPYTINRIELMRNGDLVLLIDGGLRWAGGQDSLYRFRAGDISPAGLVWKTVFDAAGNNSDLTTPEHASVLSADMAVDEQGSFIYVTGASNGWTGAEPYWNPFVFKFSLADGSQLWDRTGVVKGGPHGAFNIIQSLVGSLQADSYGQAISLNGNNEPLLGMWADGGNTYLLQDPWLLSGEAANQDGDGFWGFKARTFAPLLGRLNPDGVSGWLRSHRVKPNPNTDPDQNATLFLDVSPVYSQPSEMYAVGWTFGMPEVNAWDASLGKGTIAKLDLADGGTSRLFVDRVAGVEEYMSIIAHPGRKTFTAVGYAISGAPVLNPLQASPAGSEDAYILTFTEEIADNFKIQPSLDGFQLQFTAAAPLNYKVLRSDDLGTADPWANVPGLDVSSSAAGEGISIEIPATEIPGFFRLLAE